MNKERLLQLRSHILAHPDKFRYNYWYCEPKHPNASDPEHYMDRGSINLTNEVNKLFTFTGKVDSNFKPEKVLDFSCNTLCCVAGTTCALWYEQILKPASNASFLQPIIFDEARHILGLTLDQANMLFYAQWYEWFEPNSSNCWSIEHKPVELATYHDAIERIDFLLSLPEGAK